MAMVMKKEGNSHMYLDFCVFNKLTIKDKFPVLVIDDLMDEIHGAKCWEKSISLLER